MSAAEVVIRGFESGDGEGVARIALENGELAPERFRQPTEEGFADFFEGDGEWRAGDGNLALVADVDGDVAGYLSRRPCRSRSTARSGSHSAISPIGAFSSGS